jgi:hypothetical protein
MTVIEMSWVAFLKRQLSALMRVLQTRLLFGHGRLKNSINDCYRNVLGGFLKKTTKRAYTLPLATALCRKRRRRNFEVIGECFCQTRHQEKTLP